MQLINAHPVPATVTVTQTQYDGVRRAYVAAKATFRTRGSRAELETDAPMPWLAVDEPTDLGLLPNDTTPRLDDAFEVLLLGRARASGGLPVQHQAVTLAVGGAMRQLIVFGDRAWHTGIGGPKIGTPKPFRSMPLTWDRAFGGKCDVYLDARSPLQVCDPRNPLGKGFDPTPLAHGLRDELRLPEGWPQIRYVRVLPNLEAPQARIARGSDAPDPVCWATAPSEVGLPVLRAPEPRRPGLFGLGRAHPDWMIERPEAGAMIRMSGLDEGSRAPFCLPRMSVLVDREASGGAVQHQLTPNRLLLLPEDHRLALSFATTFTLPASECTGRLRLRLAEGWCPPPLRIDGAPA